jgi:glycosyltransferase involved in cell wall biosynthesis
MSATVATAPATFVHIRGRADATWRVAWPAQALGAKVAAIPEADAEKALQEPNMASPFPWAMRMRETNGRETLIGDGEQWAAFTATRPKVRTAEALFPDLEGAAVFTRPCLARATLALMMRQQGTLTVAETDDNYFAPDRQNIVQRTNALGEKGFDLHAKAMASFDRNVFSTAWLRDRYYREYKRRFGGKELPEPFVARNHVPSWAWPERADYDGPLRVGYMGSVSHLWDVHIAHAAFHAARYHRARTLMIGYNPADPDPGVPAEARNRKSRAVSERWAKVISEHIPWVEPVAYHRAALPLDIGLAPLRKSDFTCGKSDSKLLEFGISGAAVVCSRHPVFERAGWVHEVDVLYAQNQEDMALQTQRLLHDPILRRDLVQAAQEKIRNERNEQTMAREWSEALAT